MRGAKGPQASRASKMRNSDEDKARHVFPRSNRLRRAQEALDLEATKGLHVDSRKEAAR